MITGDAHDGKSLMVGGPQIGYFYPASRTRST